MLDFLKKIYAWLSSFRAVSLFSLHIGVDLLKNRFTPMKKMRVCNAANPVQIKNRFLFRAVSVTVGDTFSFPPLLSPLRWQRISVLPKRCNAP